MVRRFFLQLKGVPSQPVGVTGDITPGSVAYVPDEVVRNEEKIANRQNFIAFEAVIPAGSRTVPAYAAASQAARGGTIALQGIITRPHYHRIGMASTLSTEASHEGNTIRLLKAETARRVL